MRAPRRSHLLLLLSFVYLGVAGIAAYDLHTGKSREYDTDEAEMRDSDRNERSTPRALVLPANPAIAEEYERRKILDDKDAGSKWCLAQLNSVGIVVGDRGELLHSQVIQALRHYQKTHGLLVTGLLNTDTERILGCQTR